MNDKQIKCKSDMEQQFLKDYFPEFDFEKVLFSKSGKDLILTFKLQENDAISRDIEKAAAAAKYEFSIDDVGVPGYMFRNYTIKTGNDMPDYVLVFEFENIQIFFNEKKYYPVYFEKNTKMYSSPCSSGGTDFSNDVVWVLLGKEGYDSIPAAAEAFGLKLK